MRFERIGRLKQWEFSLEIGDVVVLHFPKRETLLKWEFGLVLMDLPEYSASSRSFFGRHAAAEPVQPAGPNRAEAAAQFGAI